MLVIFFNFTSQKEFNVKRHMKREHAGLTEIPMPLGQQHDTTSEDKKADTAKDNTSDIKAILKTRIECL
jgi:hypothetical protein